MALDLLRGKTRRSWAAGLVTSEAIETLRQAEDTAALGKRVGDEMRGTYDLVASLSNQGKISPDRRRALAPLLRDWQEWSSARAGRFAPADHVALLNFRARNKHYLDELGRELEASKISPANLPGAPTPPGAGTLLLKNLALGALGLCGLALWARPKKGTLP